MLGAQGSYEKWRDAVFPVLEAGPSHPHYKAAVHSFNCSWAFLFGAAPRSHAEERAALLELAEVDPTPLNRDRVYELDFSHALLFGSGGPAEGTSLGGSDSVQEKRPGIVTKMRQFRSIVAEMWQKCGRSVALLRLRG